MQKKILWAIWKLCHHEVCAADCAPTAPFHIPSSLLSACVVPLNRVCAVTTHDTTLCLPAVYDRRLNGCI